LYESARGGNLHEQALLVRQRQVLRLGFSIEVVLTSIAKVTDLAAAALIFKYYVVSLYID
jgi:hypothetical protein